MATNPQQTYQNAADASSAYGQGYANMQAILAQQLAQNNAAWMQQVGIDPSSYVAGSQFPAGVLAGAYGNVPGAALAAQGQAYGGAFGAMPSIFQGQLAYNQGIQAQDLAHQAAMASLQQQASAASSSGDGGDGGLTPYQAASLALRGEEIQYDRARNAAGDELDWAKFQFEVEQAELDRASKENSGVFDAMLLQMAIDPSLKNNKKFMRQLMAAAGMAGDVSGGIDLFTGQTEAATEAAAAVTGKREEMWDTMRSFNYESGNKQSTINAIMDEMRGPGGKFHGVAPAKVRKRVTEFVNSHWANWHGGGGDDGTQQANREWWKSGLNDNFKTYFEDYRADLPTTTDFYGNETTAKPKYRDAFNAIYGALRADYGLGKAGRWRGGIKDSQVRNRINTYLGSRGLRPPGSSAAQPPRHMNPNPPAAQAERAARIRQMAGARRTPAQRTFLRNYTRKYGRA